MPGKKSRNGSKYTTERGKELIRLVSNGLTLDQASKQIGISRRTIYRWKAKYKRFSPKFQRAHDHARNQIKRAREMKNREIKFYKTLLKINPHSVYFKSKLEAWKSFSPSTAIHKNKD